MKLRKDKIAAFILTMTAAVATTAATMITAPQTASSQPYINNVLGSTSIETSYPATLYMIGNATAGGWTLTAATAMTTVSDGKYTYEGQLSAGELKFLTATSDWVPSWGPTAATASTTTAVTIPTMSACTLENRTSDSGTDKKFNIQTAGYYRITVDLTTESPVASFTTHPTTITPIGTSVSSTATMTETSFGSGEYKASNVTLTSGTLAFRANNGTYYGPTTYSADAIDLSSGTREIPVKACSIYPTVTTAASMLNLSTDKACYTTSATAPATVTFTSASDIPSGTRIRYQHLGTVLEDRALTEAEISAKTWTWTPPTTDYQGYLAELYTESDETTTIQGTIAVDMSSDWKRFPRYGFVATFNYDEETQTGKSDDVVASDMAWLNRCHINGVQFQDWHYSHHHPCPPKNDDGTLYSFFQDIAYRWNSTHVIKQYIQKQHDYGMKSIFYNLAFGALADTQNRNGDTNHNSSPTDAISGTLADGKTYSYSGVPEDWYLYKGDNGEKYSPEQVDKHTLPDAWKSDIYIVNPGNTDWINYMNLRNEDVYNNFDFDGFQIDQLGERGWLFDKNGNHCYLPDKYELFIEGMFSQRPEKELIMNSVSRYGTAEIVRPKTVNNATKQVSFAYNEVWDGTYDDLYTIITENRTNGGSATNMQTCFAAYMNYNQQEGTFNTPGVLLTDAVIFALGGSHLELGDHMLCHEYFPFDAVTMTDELKASMVNYYDFLTAYENLLRDGGTEENLTATMTDLADGATGSFTAETGKICRYGKNVDGKHVIHLLNFKNADSTSWRDFDGTMPEPTALTSLPMTVTTSDTISKVWVATPDYNAGVPVSISFTQTGSTVSFTVPNLKYWTMIVME